MYRPTGSTHGPSNRKDATAKDVRFVTDFESRRPSSGRFRRDPVKRVTNEWHEAFGVRGEVMTERFSLMNLSESYAMDIAEKKANRYSQLGPISLVRFLQHTLYYTYSS